MSFSFSPAKVLWEWPDRLSGRSLRLSAGGPFIYYISANRLRFFNQEKLNKMIKGLSDLTDKNIKRRRPRKVGKGGRRKADPTGNLP